MISPDSYCFSISYKNNKYQCGYIILEYINDDFIVSEYSTASNVTNMYSDIRKHIYNDRAYNRCKSIGKFMFKAGSINYAVGFIDEKGKLNNEDLYGRPIKTPEYVTDKVYTYSNSSDIFIKDNDFKSKRKYKISENLSLDISGTKFKSGSRKGEYKAYDKNSYTNITKKWNCGVTAGLHILAIKGAVKESITNEGLAKIYNRLFFHVRSQSLDYYTGINNSIKVYGVEPAYADEAIRSYFKYDTKFTNTTSIHATNPSIIWFKLQLSLDRPIMFCYYILTKGKGKSGHAITVFGYRIASEVINHDKKQYSKSYNYLAVFDGWNSKERYINYSTIDFCETTHAYSYICKT